MRKDVSITAEVLMGQQQSCAGPLLRHTFGASDLSSVVTYKIHVNNENAF